MPTLTPTATQQIIPYLMCADIAANLEFLERAFGLEPREVNRDSEGQIRHAQAGIGEAIVMLGGAHPEYAFSSARALPSVHAGVFVYVDDVDTHCAQARAAGAKIDFEPQDGFAGPDRGYAARDLEGNIWFFATHVPGDG